MQRVVTDGLNSRKELVDVDCGVSSSPSLQLVQSLGVAIYRALDWGLDDSEERELSPQLERLIERMAAGDQDGEGDGATAGNGAMDEGYSGQEEEEEEEEGAMRPVCTFRQVMALCASRLADPSLAAEHYQAVCRALFLETLELQTFLIKIRDAKEVRALRCIKSSTRLLEYRLHARRQNCVCVNGSHTSRTQNLLHPKR